MKREMTQTVSLCDNCGEKDRLNLNHLTTCLSCGKEYCFNCYEKVGRNFEHGVNFSGSGDGYFCNQCISEPQNATKELLSAYLRIQALRQEAKTMWQEYETRRKKAEEEVKRLRGNF